MNISYRLFIIFCFFTFVTSFNVNADVNQASSRENYSSTTIIDPEFGISVENNDILDLFFYPIKFTPAGIRGFLSHTFNHPEYKNVLPHQLDHVEQFLLYGYETKQDRSYPQTVFKLFMAKLKESTFVNAYAYNELIEKLPELLQPYFSPKEQEQKEGLLQKIKDSVYKNFLSIFSNFSTFKEEPQQFVSGLAQEINNIVQHSVENDIHTAASEEKLRQTIIRFLDLCLNKLVWSPSDIDYIWPNIKEIGESLKQFDTVTLFVDATDKNDLYRSLVIQFCKFLDLAGSDLSPEFYEEIVEEITTNSFEFLDLPDQEELVTPKRKLLADAVFMGEGKVHARIHQGILSEPIVAQS